MACCWQLVDSFKFPQERSNSSGSESSEQSGGRFDIRVSDSQARLWSISAGPRRPSVRPVRLTCSPFPESQCPGANLKEASEPEKSEKEEAFSECGSNCILQA